MKTEAIKYLENLSFEWKKNNSNMPEYAIPRTKYSDTDTNGLTKCIIDFIRLSGGYAERINTQGQYNEKLGIWTKGNTRKGTADIHACLSGRHLSIEVKKGYDRQSEHQQKIQKEVQRARGIYFIVKDFEQFINELKRLKLI